MQITGNKVIDQSKQGEAFSHQEAASSMQLVNLKQPKLFLESYGCAMNFADSEIVASILIDKGYTTTKDPNEADAIFINTCAIRENAEQRVRQRLKDFKKIKKVKPDLIVGVLGCMAERLKSQFLDEEKLLDIVVGPDAYRDLPNLIEKVEDGHKAVNVLLSKEETYADITPVRLMSNGVTAFISIMRGCDNMCSFCVVPFTRGRERSRDPQTIVREAKELFEQGYREVTLLGQNVDSYLWHPDTNTKKEILKLNTPASISVLEENMGSAQAALNPSLGGSGEAFAFADLLEMVAQVHPDLRIRFSTSNPRDMTDAVIHSMNKYENICKYIHLPVQSGSTTLLEKMNRGYTRQQYMQRIESIRNIIPDCGISTDVMTGFCSETDEEHNETLSLMEWAQYDFAYMFAYSERPGTAAAKKFTDDVSEQIKSKRLSEIVALQQKLSAEQTKKGLNKIHRVLIEGVSKKSNDMFMGRNTQNSVIVFPKENFKIGEYVNVLAEGCTVATLIGKVVK